MATLIAPPLPYETSSRAWRLHSAGVDWLSVTATAHSAKGQLWRAAGQLLDVERDVGNDRSVSRWRGYDGWKCGSVMVGERADSCYCQVSGHAASVSWLGLMALQVNVTRIDVQATAVSPRPEWDEVGAQWDRIERDADLRKLAGWRSRIQTKPSGDTLYVGSPKSERRLRLYNKHAEDPEHYPVGAWRYEVQARDGLGGSIATGLADRGGDPLACIATVHECFRARGVLPRFRTSGRGLLGSVPRSRSDYQRTLAWLREYVRPTVARLIAHGHGGDVRRALGIR